MICENCNDKPATVHLVEIINQKKKEIHLCEECAANKGMNIATPFQFSGLISGMTQDDPEMVEMDEPTRKCPRCGITYHDFQASGKFGCSEDYNTFRETIIPLVGKIQGDTYHKGKQPTNMPEEDESRKQDNAIMEIEKLQGELQKAIAIENYEKAAEIRDRIQALKKNAGTPERE